MWKQGESQNIENLDNYLSAIEQAKKDLFNLNEEIKLALSSRDEIVSTNNALLKDKLEEIEKEKKSIESLKAMTNDIHANNSNISDDLNNQIKKFMDEQEEFDKEKVEFLGLVQQKEKSIDAREQDLSKLSMDIDIKKKELDLKIKDNESILNKILDETKDSREIMSLLAARRKDHEDMMADSNVKLEESKKLNAHTQSLKEDVENKLSVAQQALEESRINKINVENDLVRIIKEKEILNNILIENKKSKLEAIKSIETSQRLIAESNLKIAELKDLKEAMAKS